MLVDYGTKALAGCCRKTMLFILFNKVLHNPDHVLHRLLPPVAHTSHNYNLRPRAHDRSLPERLTHVTDCNFIIRMLFYQVY